MFNILLAEDELPLRKLINTILKVAGFAFMKAATEKRRWLCRKVKTWTS